MKTVHFPKDFTPIKKENNKGVYLRASKDLDSLSREGKQIITKIDLPEMNYYILSEDFHIYNPFGSSNSSGSKAVYIARSADKFRGLLLQYLPPFSNTSNHYHKNKYEAYHCFAGNAKLLIDAAEHNLEIGKTVVVKPNQVHSVITDSDPCLTLLEITGDPKGLSMLDHNYIN
ncbi:hypothetical protein C4544_00430 [candidate division WS5 bacterium]|uniref:Cupin type-2 domain-containing protein n=1 Tax=candidate division WS5 bacterium TaxID=2093353 RepID=A0A419DGV1_9BACT|nr:MAG: hypothetical protein C4544_00430 [candidate division WS5 bacterium]